MCDECDLVQSWRKAECLNHLQVAYSTDYLDALNDIGQSSILNQPCAAVLFYLPDRDDGTTNNDFWLITNDSRKLMKHEACTMTRPMYTTQQDL